MKQNYFSLFIAIIILFSCKKTDSHLTKITAKTITIDNSYQPNADVSELIAPYKNKLQAEMEEVLCYAPKKLVKNDGELPIFKKLTNSSIDFVMFNSGGIRSIIPAGNVTKERAFKIMPFENELLVTTLSGEKVIELINYFMDRKRPHPLSKNVELVIDGDDFSLKINGKPFDKTKSYNVMTNDYLYNGGSRMLFFKNPEKLTVLNMKLRDAIIAYFKKVDTLKSTIDNRVIVK